MSQAEKYSWASLVTTGAIYFFFKMRMLDGWQVADQSVGQLFGVYIAVIILFIVAEAIIGIVLAKGTDGEIIKDERDLAIEARAEQNGSIFIVVAINILIFQLLADQAYPDHILPRIDLSDTATMFFLLLSTLIIASIVQRISTLVMYGMQSVRG